jgi:hypothetical protein
MIKKSLGSDQDHALHRRGGRGPDTSQHITGDRRHAGLDEMINEINRISSARSCSVPAWAPGSHQDEFWTIMLMLSLSWTASLVLTPRLLLTPTFMMMRSSQRPLAPRPPPRTSRPGPGRRPRR